MDKLNTRTKNQIKFTIGVLLIIAGLILGPLPLVPAFGLIIAGTTLVVSSKPKGWRFPKAIDQFIPNKLKQLIYKDLKKKT